MGRVNRDSILWKSTYTNYKKSDKPIKVKGYEQKHIEIRKEPMELQHELVQLNERIKSMIVRKKFIQRQLRKQGQKPIRSEYFDKPIFIYVLELEDSCWYIGTSRNVERRFKKHCNGKGAKWTKLHPPIKIHYQLNTNLTIDSEACRKEDELTLEYAREYGVDRVRGGGYCQTKPKWPELAYEPDLSWVV